jgi:hypothetical protein
MGVKTKQRTYLTGSGDAYEVRPQAPSSEVEGQLRPGEAPWEQGGDRALEDYRSAIGDDLYKLRRFEFYLFLTWLRETYDAETPVYERTDPASATSPEKVETDPWWYQEVEFPQAALSEAAWKLIQSNAKRSGLDIELDDGRVFVEDREHRDLGGGWDGWRRAESERAQVEQFAEDYDFYALSTDGDVVIREDFDGWFAANHPGQPIPDVLSTLTEVFGYSVWDTRQDYQDYLEEENSSEDY